MQKFIILLLIFFSAVYGTEIIDNNISQNSKQNLIYLSYDKKPSRVYVKQIFEIKIKAVVATTKFDKISTNFKGGVGYKVLNKNNSWKWYNDNIYFNTYYIQVTKDNSVFPKITVSILLKNDVIAKGILKPITPNIIKLQYDPLFSGVIANNLKLVKTKTTKFNNKSNILVMEIEGNKANLRDFKVANTLKDGIDSYSVSLPNIKVFYFAIIPNTEKIFRFSYFNLKLNKFEKLSIPVEIDTEDTSTQLGLNPKESKLEIYKNITLVSIALFSLFIFLFRRKIVYILIFIVIVVYLFIFYNPFDSIILKKNTKIRILPTYNSTIFYITNRKIIAEKLNTVKDYIKVLLPNGKIGWIKKDKN